MKKTIYSIIFVSLVILGIFAYKVYVYDTNNSVNYSNEFGGAPQELGLMEKIFSSQSRGSVGVAGASMKGASIGNTSFGNSTPTAFAKRKIAFKVGADQDLNLFRENIKKGHIPNLDVITYNGVFGDYHFNLPEGKCEKMFCPLLALATGTNINNETGYYIQVGLGSNINKENFKRKKTNFVIVIDKSGSMGESLSEYYYNNNFTKNEKKCGSDKIYFAAGNKCITEDEQKEYEGIMKKYSSKSKIELVKQATLEIVNKMQEDDRISIVLFDTNASIAHPLVKIKNINKEKFKEHVNNIIADGGTNMESSFKKVEEIFSDDLGKDGYQNRVIFLTDAMPNINDSNPYSLSSYTKKLAKKGIYFTFIGVGIDFQQAFIQKLAKIKGTNYFFISNSYDIYKRLIDEFDYNFFPMVLNLSFKTDNNDIIEKVYGTDSNIKNSGELFHINTLFPTPPTTDGYRGSIILLKLKNKPEKDIKFTVSYENIEGEKENTENTVYKIENSLSAKKGIVLINYVDTIKKSILDNDTELLDKLKKYMENNKGLFKQDDEKMIEKEMKTITKLKELLKNGVKVEKDYWQSDK